MAVHVDASSRVSAAASRQVRWLVAGFALGFLVPFVCADLLGLQRDVYYGVYCVLVFGFFAFWAHSTEQSIRTMIARRWVLAIVLGLAVAGVMAFIVLQQDATSRPTGLTLVAALMWRGLVYGMADGLLLSSFPILAVFDGACRQPASLQREWQARDRRARAAGVDRHDGRLPRRVQRFPLGQNRQPDRR
jgi:hypothetical protein